MATINKTFSVKNGVDVANTIIVDSSRNLSNIAAANVVSINVSANIANAGNLLVTQNSFTGNLAVTQNTITGNLSVSTLANIASLNAVTFTTGAITSTQNTSTGNLAVTQNTSTGNLSVSTLANVTTLNVASNIAVGNLTITQNTTGGNISAANLTATTLLTAAAGQINGQLTVAGNLIVNGTTITLNASSVQTNDQYIMLASNNFADSIDSGFATLSKNTAQANVYSGLIRHAADETWHLFEGYALMNAYPATINTAQTNVATLNANVIAQQITLGAINVASWIGSSYAAANAAANTVAVFANGTLTLAAGNLNFNNTSTVNVTASANGTNQTNVSFVVNTAALPSGSSVNVYSNAGSVLAATPNLVFLNSASIVITVTANGTNGVNVTPTVNATLNLTSLNVSGNISNTGNILVSQNGVFGNIFTGNVGVSGAINVGVFSINTVQQTVATVSQTALDNFSATAFGTAEYLIQANCKSSFYITKILVVNDGTNVYLDEYSTILTNGPVGSLTAAIAAGNVQLLFTANNATSTVINTTRYSLNI
jgi:hypothetical protein